MSEERPPPAEYPRNIKLIVAYDGTRYHGWQRQAEGIDTIQGRLEHVACRVVGHPVRIHGAGRTDAGVHALGQGANFKTLRENFPLENLRRAINAKLPPDIAVLSAKEAPSSFHASGSAVGKTYRYRLYVGPAKPVLRANTVWCYERELDVDRMSAAAVRLLGEHDFRGLAFSAEKRENTVRTITRCDVMEADDEVHVTVSGNGFLYKMVRNLVGTLMEIGRGRWQPGRIDEILQTRDRSYAGPTAPARGLCLMHVAYPL